MNDSSNSDGKQIEHLSLRQMEVLIDVLLKSRLTDIQYIVRRYNERAQYFDATMSFLISTGVVELDGESYSIDENIRDRLSKVDSATALKTVILEAIFDNPRNPHRGMFLDYLSSFKAQGGQIERIPLNKDRTQEISIRNLLMELGVIRYDHDHTRYYLTEEHLDLYLYTRSESRPMSPFALKELLHDRDSLGFAAEMAVLTFEKRRVGATLSKLVDHVAARNVRAGFDIKSVSVVEEGQVIPRYIEVKAVSGSTYKFYWSINELNTAEMLGDYYYLYLVPVWKGRSFDLKRLMIIKDPYNGIYVDRARWSIEDNVISCTFVGPS